MLLFLQEQYVQDEYYQGLRTAFKNGGKRVFAIIKALERHHGYIHKSQLAVYTFSPVSDLKGHKRIDTLILNLKTMGVLHEDGDFYVINSRLSMVEPAFHISKAISMAERFVLEQFLEWSKKIGLASFNTGTTFSDFGKFSWGFTSPSYSVGLTTYSSKSELTPGFIVADALLGKEVTDEEIDFFLQKISILQQMKGIRRFLPVLIIDYATNDALDKLKKKGVLIGFVSQLFGKGYSDLLKNLINIVANAGAILKANPEGFLQLMTNIDRLVQGKTNNLRGDLFELAVGFYHSRLGSSIDIGRIINHEGVVKEYDVFAVYPNEIYVAECKGIKRAADVEEVETWISIKVPLIRRWIAQQPSLTNKTLICEFWSTGGFHPDTHGKIEASKKTPKYKMSFFDEKMIMKKGKEPNMPRFTEVLNQYFVKERF